MLIAQARWERRPPELFSSAGRQITTGVFPPSATNLGLSEPSVESEEDDGTWALSVEKVGGSH